MLEVLKFLPESIQAAPTIAVTDRLKVVVEGTFCRGLLLICVSISKRLAIAAWCFLTLAFPSVIFALSSSCKCDVWKLCLLGETYFLIPPVRVPCLTLWMEEAILPAWLIRGSHHNYPPLPQPPSKLALDIRYL